ncbi:hypothetical protein L207DRAFT_486635 [Hyaloscypha variabilis F]|uniref:Zn(2)-C6 fungal-type domain-containing protein n=1 Tax=Hyaloscypha variabilis (strain UAMH 11265 / GT02V1 / F) TaxID=1149755 RepID=A0A2J6RWG2_HYAVF|nr:hypothetical protein L207DRAFT_486635 [Hyaloscypha variabilis F]
MNRDRSSSPSIPAPYGKACATCAQSKCKCFIRRAGGPCERCRRLKKECRPPAAVRHRSPRKPAVSRTARLEEKLDSLVSLIKAGSRSNEVISSALTAAIENSTPYDTVLNVPVLTPVSTDDSMGSAYSLAVHTGLRDNSTKPSLVQAEEYLRSFQINNLQYFPFMYIPPTTSAQQLQQEKPFLWLCIMAVSSKSTSQQQALGSEIRHAVAHEVVVQLSRNLEFLLGILIFIAWSHYQVNSKPFLSVFTQLAASLVYDLGLNMPVPKDIQIIPCLKERFMKPTTPRTMEERRAVLGCFLITSIISSFLQKMDPLRWTPHMDECLQFIDEAKDCHNDAILVQLVRLQLIVEKVGGRPVDEAAMESFEQITEALPFQSQLHDIKVQLISEPKPSAVLLLHLYSIELDMAISPSFLYTNQLTFQQRTCLGAALESIKSWLEVFFTIAPADYVGISFPITTQLVRCLLTLSRLTTLETLSWDEHCVWKKSDALSVLDRVINNMEQVEIVAHLDNGGSPGADVFASTARMFRSLRSGWEASLATDEMSSVPLEQNIEDPFPADVLGVDSFDNDWLMDLLLSPNYYTT